MAETINAGGSTTIDHPGTYEIHVSSGDAVVWADGETHDLKDAPKSRGGQVATVKTEGRLQVLAPDNQVTVEIIRQETPSINVTKAVDGAQAIPEIARKAAGENASEPSQPPNAGMAQNANPDANARAAGAITNRPTASEFITPDPVRQHTENVHLTNAGDVVSPAGQAPEDKPKVADSSSKRHNRSTTQGETRTETARRTLTPDEKKARKAAKTADAANSSKKSASKSAAKKRR